MKRLSPKRGTILDLFDDLVHFMRVFPHKRLTLEVPLVDIEEWRYLLTELPTATFAWRPVALSDMTEWLTRWGKWGRSPFSRPV